MEAPFLRGLAIYRWVAWVWIAAMTYAGRDNLGRPALAWAFVVAALAVTAWLTVLLRRDPDSLLAPLPVTVELICGASLIFFDGVVYEPGHAFATSQSLGAVWPTAGVLTAGIAWGPLAGALSGSLMGLARFGSTLVNGIALSDITGGRITSLISTTVVYTLAGAVAGYIARLLRRAEGEISAARARDELARTLHDGVLQTLAVVERRTEDPALARLAREQERELREYLFGSTAETVGGGGDLGSELRAAAGHYETSFGGRAQVLVADDLPRLRKDEIEAIAGAVGEALTNAGKHGGAARVTVYVEPDGRGLFCSVKDDGTGFDTAAVSEGIGVTHSIRGRIAEVGGRADIRSRPGDGAEVCLWIP
ncbi:MAG: ATP-binding protein [Acidimicrobiia bacterium]|nr:ATP-binding protein [Acidimicrobiia bacterium]